jgi:hypothetical protein
MERPSFKALSYIPMIESRTNEVHLCRECFSVWGGKGSTKAPPRRHQGTTKAPPRHHQGTTKAPTAEWDWRNLLPRKQQFVLTHTIRQSEIPALLDSWITNTSSVKMLPPQKIAWSYIRKNVTCVNFGQWKVGQGFPVSCKFVDRWFATSKLLFLERHIALPTSKGMDQRSDKEKADFVESLFL